jgi:hypothetical protein
MSKLEITIAASNGEQWLHGFRGEISQAEWAELGDDAFGAVVSMLAHALCDWLKENPS